jgi:4a-hydroxytetrahydrobiopterin dehydratase
MELKQMKCTPCEGNVPPLSKEHAHELWVDIPGWDLQDNYITRTYLFSDFDDAMVFVNRVAAIAQREGHHPDITILYNVVTLTLTTHAISGLSQNDFILAAKVDAQ